MSADFPGNSAAAVTPTQVMGPLLRHGAAQQVQLVALPRRLDQVEATLTSRLGPLAAPGKMKVIAHGGVLEEIDRFANGVANQILKMTHFEVTQRPVASNRANVL